MNFKLTSVVVVAVAGSLAACSASSNVGSHPDPDPKNDAGDAGGVHPIPPTHPADAGPDVSCAAMFDMDYETALQQCERTTDCKVCAQAGTQALWLAQENASVCACPALDPNRFGPPADAGAAGACWAIRDLESADDAKWVCAQSPDCVVCPQSVDALGKTIRWLAQDFASTCPCPPVGLGMVAEAGVNEASVPDATPALCPATFDITSKSTADTICGSDPNCAVCVQKVDAQGNATTWLAQRNAPACPCPTLATP